MRADRGRSVALDSGHQGVVFVGQRGGLPGGPQLDEKEAQFVAQRGVGGPVNASQVELLSIAYQGSQTMLELVNNLLDISKMEQGRMHLDLEPVAPYAIIDRAIDSCLSGHDQFQPLDEPSVTVRS